MGNVQERMGNTTVGQTVTQVANEITKLFTCIATAPKTPITMPNLGDGRSSDELRTTAEIMYNMDTKQNVNIAFVGPNSDYKTGFINSCRFIADCRPDTGIVSPKNAAIQYIHCDPSYQHVRFWDIGDVPLSYVDRCLYAFDAVVLVSTDALRESDIDLVRQGCKIQPGCSVLVVRTAMDQFVDRTFGLNPSATAIKEEQAKQGDIIRESIKNELRKGGIQCPNQCNAVYLCSGPGMLAARAVNFDGTKYIWDEYDFMKGILDCIGKRRY